MKKLERYLPCDILAAIKDYGQINEINIKRNSRVVVKKDRDNYIMDIDTPSVVFDGILDKLLEHSYHSKLPEIVEGYISLGEGYRVGIAGQAVTKDGTITNISEIGSVCIRIPHTVRGISEPIVAWLDQRGYAEGVLIYSPPGIGKTTLLRDLTLRLCDTPIYKKIALIDTRCEIYLPFMSRYPMLNVYSSYPKDKGIEHSVRTLAPDIVVCDEIGNDAETDAILKNQSAGVPIIATAHGSDFNSLIKRKNIRRMHDACVFGCYVGIKRRTHSNKFDFTVTERDHGV